MVGVPMGTEESVVGTRRGQCGKEARISLHVI